MASNIGSTIAVAAGIPATFDQAGYEALTYVNVLGPVMVPFPAMSTDLINFDNITTGITGAVKGMSTGKTHNLAFTHVDGDAGQGALKTYAAPDYIDSVTLRTIMPNATRTFYMVGLVLSLEENEGTGSQYQGFTVDFRQTLAHLQT